MLKLCFDDIIVHGATPEEHDKRLRVALQRSREAKVKINDKKCKFGLPEVTYLGRIISASGVKPDPEKIRDILEMPRPTDKDWCPKITGYD